MKESIHTKIDRRLTAYIDSDGDIDAALAKLHNLDDKISKSQLVRFVTVYNFVDELRRARTRERRVEAIDDKILSEVENRLNKGEQLTNNQHNAVNRIQSRIEASKNDTVRRFSSVLYDIKGVVTGSSADEESKKEILKGIRKILDKNHITE